MAKPEFYDDKCGARIPPIPPTAKVEIAEYREGDLEKFFGADPDFTGGLSSTEHLDRLGE